MTTASLMGQIINDQYRVDAFIAAGGMGAVYRVWDLRRQVSLAMKGLHAELADDPSIVKRFQREANALKKLTHPHIVPFYGLEEWRGSLFLLAEFIDGMTLKDVLRARQEPFPVEETLIYLKALCAALGYAHANTVIHCDVKPGNVMIDQGGVVYLTDFGIARHAESTTTTLGFAGTVAYMAPEQIRGEAVSPATDIYALGVVLYEMLAGRRPFTGSEEGSETGGTSTAERLRYAHLAIDPPDPRQFNPHIPPALADIVLRALEKNPGARYTNTQTLFEAAVSACGTTSQRVRDRVKVPAAPDDATVIEPPTAAVESVSGTPARAATKPPARSLLVSLLPFAVVGVVLLVAAAAIVILIGLFSRLAASPTQAPPTEHIPPPSEAALTTAAAMPEDAEPVVVIVTGEADSALDQTDEPPTPAPMPGNSLPSSPQGHIVYTCYNGSVDNLCLMDADGGGQRQVTSEGATTWYASISPFGDLIFFSSRRGGSFQLYQMNMDGSGMEQMVVCPDDNGCFAPELSDDGTRIAFTAAYGRTGQNIWSMNRDGSDVRQLTFDVDVNNVDPVWSPDGSQIVFASDRGGSISLYVMNRDGGDVRQITSGLEVGGRSDWSPDGQYIATYAGLENSKEIFIMRPDGGDLRQISSGGGNRSPSFSPDSQWITYAATREGDSEIFIMRIDGSDRQQLTNNSQADWQPRWGP